MDEVEKLGEDLEVAQSSLDRIKSRLNKLEGILNE